MEWRRVTVGAAVLLGVLAAVGSHGGVTVDEHVYRATVAGMRHGSGYYEAMSDALAPVYGLPSSVRAFRLPTVFWVWRWVPFGVAGLRVLFVALMAAGAWLGGRAARAPGWVSAVVFVVLLAAGGVLPGAPTEQFLLVELWAVPLAVGAWWAYRRGWWWTAAGLAVAAAAVREFAVLVVVGGLLAALLERRPVRPWVAACAAVAGVAVWHVQAAGGWVTAGGHESPLIGHGYNLAERFGRMSGFGLPAVVGPVLMAAAVYLAYRRREWFVLPLLLLPVTAVVADRPYWGALAVPFYLLVVGGEVERRLRRVHDEHLAAVP